MKNRRIILRVLKIMALVLAAAILLTVCAFVFSPKPVSWLMRRAFDKPNHVFPAGYEAIAAAVSVTQNIEYPSAFADNTLDVYMPKSATESLPVIIWVHGGGYIGGDKSDVQIYATALAAQGFAVVSMNYARAPEAKYPTPILQLGEVCGWVTKNAETYALDASRIVLAGDSAGAHTAASFALVQTNPEYAELVGIAPTLNADALRATLLYCGPYDAEKMAELKSVFGFLLSRAGWAYYGSRGWAAELADEATIRNHLTADFPPSFVTDGNSSSFEEHARELVTAMEQVGIPNESYFLPLSEEKTMHEYQFLLDTPAGAESFRRTCEFLQKYA